MVALARTTRDEAVLFARNSDRPADECQPLVLIARKRHPVGARVRCQYIEIPQVPETARVLGSQPFWLWGFEHGLNEHGVAMGNHTVFARDQPASTGLIGMDLVRLGLERGRTAREAVELICDLIERHGQGGSGFLDKDWPYNNSFLVADPHEAHLLETSGRNWALRHIRDAGSATNHLTIGSNWDVISAEARKHAVEAGWWRAEDSERFDFAAAYRDTSFVPEAISSGRYRRTCEILEQATGRLTPADLMSGLRDHYGGPLRRFDLEPGDERYFAVCMHADPVGTTAASVVARLSRREDQPHCYWGSLGAPCVGVFLPYYVDAELPPVLSRGGKRPSEGSAWWGFRELLRLVECDPEHRAPHVRGCWDELEENVLAESGAVEQEAARLRRAGNSTAAADLLGGFTERNVREMMRRLAALTRELQAM